MKDGVDGDREDNPQADRERAAREGRPYALVVECDLKWSFGAPLPTVLQWEHEAHLFFYLREGDRVGSLVFDYCRFTTFGPPGEEGHALMTSGWEAYTPLRVMNSPWLARMVGTGTDLSHFVFPFHDSTFECIAQSFRPSPVVESMAEALQAAIERWE
jgi:hypothetical protein